MHPQVRVGNPEPEWSSKLKRKSSVAAPLGEAGWLGTGVQRGEHEGEVVCDVVVEEVEELEEDPEEDS